MKTNTPFRNEDYVSEGSRAFVKPIRRLDSRIAIQYFTYVHIS